MKLFYILLCIPFIDTADPGKSARKDIKIFDGSVDRIWNAKFLAALEHLNNFRCGAIIISYTWLTSAVHCFAEASDILSEMKVRIGSSYKLIGGTVYNISKYIPHPHYVPSKNDYPSLNNIAVFQTSPGMKLSEKENRFFIRLINPNYTPKFGEILVMFGWGLTHKNGSISNVINRAAVLTVDTNLCNVAWREYYHNPNYSVASNQFCASAQKRAPCSGDAGGPALLNGKLAGIVASGTNTEKICTTSNFPTIFTNVGKFVDFIKKYVKLP